MLECKLHVVEEREGVLELCRKWGPTKGVEEKSISRTVC